MFPDFTAWLVATFVVVMGLSVVATVVLAVEALRGNPRVIVDEPAHCRLVDAEVWLLTNDPLGVVEAWREDQVAEFAAQVEAYDRTASS